MKVSSARGETNTRISCRSIGPGPLETPKDQNWGAVRGCRDGLMGWKRGGCLGGLGSVCPFYSILNLNLFFARLLLLAEVLSVLVNAINDRLHTEVFVISVW